MKKVHVGRPSEGWAVRRIDVLGFGDADETVCFTLVIEGSRFGPQSLCSHI